MERSLDVRIGAFDGFSATMNKFNSAMDGVESSASGAVSKMQASFNNLKSHWLTTTAAIAAAGYTLSRAWNIAETAAQFEEQKTALDALASHYGMTATSMISSIQGAADGTVSAVDAISVANKALIMGLNPSQLEVFTSAAQRLSGALGGDTVAAFEKLTTATAIGQERQLKSLGILVDLNGAYEKYGRGLTEAEKQAINFQVVSKGLDEALRKMGPDVTSAADAMDRFKATAADLWLTFGKVLISAASFVSGGLLFVSSGFMELFNSITNILSKIAALGERLPWVGEKFKGVAETLKVYSKAADGTASSLMEMSMKAFDTGTAIWKEAEAIKGATGALNEKGGAIATVNKAYEEANEKIQGVILATAKLGASKEALIQIAAAEYAATGANTEQVKWYTQALEEQSRKEEEIAAEKERKATAQKLLDERHSSITKLGENNPYDKTVDNEALNIYQSYQSNIQNLMSFSQQVREEIGRLAEEGYISQAEAEVAYSNLAISEAQRRKDYQISAAGETFGALSNVMQNLYTATGSKNKAMFASMKAFSMAEALIKGYQATLDSYEAGAKVGGPALGAAFAAVAAASTAGMIAQIASVEPGSTTSVSSSGSAVTSYEGGSTGAYTDISSSSSESVGTQQITINVSALDPSSVNWDNLVENNIAPALESLSSGRNVTLDIQISGR